MDAATSLDDTVRKAQDILWDALPPGAVRGSAVLKLRDLLWSPEVGIALASGTEAGTLAYEIKLPLAPSSSHPSAVGAQPGRTIALGLFTPDVPKATRRKDRGSDSGSYGRGYNPYDPYGTGVYGGMGVSGGPPPMMQNDSSSPAKPPAMKLWLRLQLAKQ